MLITFFFPFLHAQSNIPKEVSEIFVQATEKAIPAVVYIEAQQQLPQSLSSNEMSHENINQGSGFLVSSDGYIITNAHLVHLASKIKIISFDKQVFDADVILLDEKTDVAILKIQANDFSYLKLSSSEDIKIGELVLAVGYPLASSLSLTIGLVSAKNVQYGNIAINEDFIRTTTPISLGSSGGPLLNLKGEVIGINTAVLKTQEGSYAGHSLAISSKLAISVLKTLSFFETDD